MKLEVYFTNRINKVFYCDNFSSKDNQIVLYNKNRTILAIISLSNVDYVEVME